MFSELNPRSDANKSNLDKVVDNFLEIQTQIQVHQSTKIPACSAFMELREAFLAE